MELSSPSQSKSTKKSLEHNPSSRPKSENGLDKIKLSYSAKNSQGPAINVAQRPPLENFMPSSFEQFNRSSAPSKRSSETWKKKSPKNKHDQHEKRPIFVEKQSEGIILPFVEHYNYIKTIPQPFTRTVMLIKDGIKVMVILRGLPGSGKSELAGKLLSEAGIHQSAHKRHIFSTDNFFVQNGCYVFVRELLGEAHSWNQRSVLAAVREDLSPVVVDNTNCEAWEMKVYVEFAVKAGYDIELLEPNTWWAKKEGELARRNVHGVPRGTIRSMLERYEKNISAHTLLQRFQLQYSLSNAPPQPARNCKWKEKFSGQKNNKPKKKREHSNKNDSCYLNDMVLPSNHHPLLPTECDIFRNVPISIEANFIPQNDFVKLTRNDKSFTPVEEVSVSFENQNEKVISLPKTLGCSDYSPVTVMKSFSTPLVTNSYEENSNLDKESLSLKSYGLVTSGSISSCPSNNPQSQNCFDVMAEANKLLAAMKKPQFSNETLISSNSEACNHGEPKENKRDPFSDLNSENNWRAQPIVMVCAERDEFSSTQSEKAANDILAGKGNSEIAEGLISSIIDSSKIEVADDISGIFPDGQDVATGEKSHNHFDKSLDYVLVNKDSTYTYQRLDSTPFCTNPFSEDFRFPITPAMENYSTFDPSMKTSVVENNETRVKTDLSNEECNFDGVNKLGIKSEVKELSAEMVENKSASLHSPFDIDKSVTPDVSKSSIEECNLDVPKPHLDRSNTFGMMAEILKGMSPHCENLPCLAKFTVKEQQNHPPKLTPSSVQPTGASSTNPYSNWGLGDYWSAESKDKQIPEEPKPCRNLSRPKLSDYAFTESNKQSLLEPKREQIDDFNSWGYTSHSLDDWTVVDVARTSHTEQQPEILPQRQRMSNRKLADSSTNTNYADFSLLNSENLNGPKVIVAHRRSITEENSWQTKTDISETMCLDKSTMTLENHLESTKSYDLNHIASLFPDIPESFITDVVERCLGDVNWAVDILLDSKHSVYADPVFKLPETPPESGSEEKAEELSEIENLAPQMIQKLPGPSAERLVEVKRMIESVVVLGKSHYSDKVLKVLKRKNPEYLTLIENSELMVESSSPSSSSSEAIVIPAENYQGNIFVESRDCNEAGDSGSEDEETTSTSEAESSSSVAKGSDENEDLQLIFNNDLILQLQQKFGNSSLPRIPRASTLMNVILASPEFDPGI